MCATPFSSLHEDIPLSYHGYERKKLTFSVFSFEIRLPSKAYFNQGFSFSYLSYLSRNNKESVDNLFRISRLDSMVDSLYHI